MARLSAERIREAAGLIDPVFLNSPQVSFEPLSNVLGADVVLKVETLNPIRSFKGRGTEFFVATLRDDLPLVAASAGNFGQGLARAGTRRGIRVVMFASERANPMKIRRMRELGAEVHLAGQDFDAAKAAARQYAEREGFRFVEDGREPAISEGAGTIAMELDGDFDAIVAPLGNGALINGVGTWVRFAAPGTRVIAVCAANAPAMEMSWRTGFQQNTETADTMADGIAVRVPVPEALEDMRGVVDDVLLVTEEQLWAAMQLLLRHTGLVVEAAGAAGIAAMIAWPERFAGRRVTTPLCGSNVLGFPPDV